MVMDLSARNDATRAAIRPARRDFAARVLLVTSRLDEPLGGARRSVIRADMQARAPAGGSPPRTSRC
jgi:hypothetical protein